MFQIKFVIMVIDNNLFKKKLYILFNFGLYSTNTISKSWKKINIHAFFFSSGN